MAVMNEIVPVDQGSKEATCATLCKEFSIDDKVQALFTKSPMENLEDFRFYFVEGKEIDTFVAAEASLKDAALCV